MGACTDKAGHSASAPFAVSIDRTPPSISCSASPNLLWPPNHELVPVMATVTVSDGLAGAAGFTLVSVTSNEPDNGLGDGDTAGDIQGFALGTPSTRGQLRAERSGAGTGRVYSLTYRATDLTGNATTCTTTVMVPRDDGR